jgi:hypothetical protein
MSSKFLSGDTGADLSSLADGTFEGNMASLKLQDLTPGTTLRANGDKLLVSTQITTADLDFVPLSNPYAAGDLQVTAGDLVALDVQTSVVPTLNAFVENTETALADAEGDILNLEGKTQYQSAAANKTSFTGDIGTTTIASLNTFASNTETNIATNSGDILALQGKTQNLRAVAGTTTFSGRVRATRIGGPTPGTDLIVDDDLDLGNLRSVTRAAAVQTALVQTDTLQTSTSGFVTLNSDLQAAAKNIIGARSVTANSLTTGSINGLRPTGGLYSGISDGTTITQALSPADLLPTSSVGSLSVPANGFAVGDAFHLVCAGILPAEDKDDQVEVELCAELADTTVVVLGSVTLDLEDFSITPSNFELEADFIVRSVGVSGSLAVNFDLTFNKRVTKDFRGTRSTSVVTLDTTQSSTLVLRASILGGNGSSILSRLAYLRKEF